MHSNHWLEIVRISLPLLMVEGGGRWAVIIGSVDRAQKQTPWL
jgi:hypothetical protein